MEAHSEKRNTFSLQRLKWTVNSSRKMSTEKLKSQPLKGPDATTPNPVLTIKDIE